MSLETTKAMMHVAIRCTLGVGAAYTSAKALTKVAEYSCWAVTKWWNRNHSFKMFLYFYHRNPADGGVLPSLKDRITIYFHELVKWGGSALVIGAFAKRMGSFAMINRFLSAFSPLVLGSMKWKVV